MTLLNNQIFANNINIALTGPMTASLIDDVLPISAQDMASLLLLIPNASQLTMIATLTDGTNHEVVSLFNSGSEIAATRAAESSTLHAWSLGNTLSVRLTAGTLNNIVSALETLEASNLANQNSLNVLADSILTLPDGSIAVNDSGDVLTL